jgi:hypothetical protein
MSMSVMHSEDAPDSIYGHQAGMLADLPEFASFVLCKELVDLCRRAAHAHHHRLMTDVASNVGGDPGFGGYEHGHPARQ